MTYGKLKEDLFRHLDVDDDEEKRAYLPVALNHAMDKVCTVFPLEGKYVIPASYIENVLPMPAYNEDIVAVNGEKTYTAEGKAYYFEASGTGKCEVTDETGTKNIELAGNGFTPYRGFCKGKTTLRFFGDYLFYVQNAAVYSAILSDKEEDIPAFASSVPYDFKTLTTETLPDGTVFTAFDGFIEEKFEEKSRRDGGFTRLTDYEVEPNKQGHVIRLNGHTLSEKIIYYRRNFRPFTDQTPDETLLEIPQGLDYVLLDMLVYRINIDEDDISVERAQHEAQQLLNWKQQTASGQNPVTEFKDVMGYLNYGS